MAMRAKSSISWDAVNDGGDGAAEFVALVEAVVVEAVVVGCRVVLPRETVTLGLALLVPPKLTVTLLSVVAAAAAAVFVLPNSTVTDLLPASAIVSTAAAPLPPPETVSVTSTPAEFNWAKFAFCTTGRTAPDEVEVAVRSLAPFSVTREFSDTQLKFAVFNLDKIIVDVNGMVKLDSACAINLGREAPSVTLLTALVPPISAVVQPTVSVSLAQVAPVKPLTHIQLQTPEDMSFFPPFKQVTSAIHEARVN